MSIVQFTLDPEQGALTAGYAVERGTTLYSRPIQGTPCRFRTCYPVTLWPIELSSASLESLDPVDTRGKWSEAVLKLNLRCQNNTTLAGLKVGENEKQVRPLDSLRFYLNGEPPVVHALYEMLFSNVTGVGIRAGADSKKTAGRRGAQPAAVMLPPSSIKAVGFEADEGMLSYTARSFTGYRLLTEYFTFPEKFLFFDVTDIHKAALAGSIKDQFEILIYLRNSTPPRDNIDASVFPTRVHTHRQSVPEIAEPIQTHRARSTNTASSRKSPEERDRGLFD